MGKLFCYISSKTSFATVIFQPNIYSFGFLTSEDLQFFLVNWITFGFRQNRQFGDVTLVFEALQLAFQTKQLITWLIKQLAD